MLLAVVGYYVPFEDVLEAGDDGVATRGGGELAVDVDGGLLGSSKVPGGREDWWFRQLMERGAVLIIRSVTRAPAKSLQVTVRKDMF